MNAPPNHDPETTQNKKGGRPKMAAEDRKTRLVKAYVTEKRYQQFKTLAKEIKRSVSYVVNELCERGKVVAAVPPELLKCFRDVSGMANNVNQIAKRLNTYGESAMGQAFQSMHDDLVGLLDEAKKYIQN